MRSDDWILVENAFAETLSSSSFQESLVIVHTGQPDELDGLFRYVTSDITPPLSDYIGACDGDCNELINGDLQITELVDPVNSDVSASKVSVRVLLAENIGCRNRPFSTRGIMSPRIDPELGRLAAVNLRAGNLVGCIYRPDIESQRTSQRFRERASMLLKAN
jgi:hypothetical protein